MSVVAGESFDASAGDEVVVDDGLDDTPVTEASLDLGDACDDCQVNVEERDSAPASLADPSGFGDSVQHFEASVAGAGSGTVERVTLTTTVPAEDVPDQPDRLTMLHGTQGEWEPPTEDEVATLSNGDARIQATFDGLSPFTVTTDETAPTITSLDPSAGATIAEQPTFTIEAQDNLGIDADASQLELGDREVELEKTDPAADCVDDPCTLTGSPSGNLLVGELDARVHIVDDSGWQTSQDATYEVINSQQARSVCSPDEQSPRPNEVVGDAATKLTVTFTDDCAVDPDEVTVTFDGTEILANVDATTITYQPQQLAEGEHTIEIEATTEGGIQRTVTWPFIVDLTPPTVETTQPAEGETVDDRPTIQLDLSDETSRIDPRTVTLSLDGEPVDASVGDGTVTYTPEDTLADGTHELELTAQVRGGNVESQSSPVEGDSGLAPGAWVLFVGAVIVVLGAAGYGLYRRRAPGFDQ
jgi:hypothetical protein